jgi:hypothetical protein
MVTALDRKVLRKGVFCDVCGENHPARTRNDPGGGGGAHSFA